MTTLQRSAVSFRRQGSSGLIWDDRVQFQALDSKAARSTFHSNEREDKALPTNNLVRNQNQDRNFQERNMIVSRPIGSSSTHSNDGDQKVQRCSFSAIFGRCMGTPAP
ncbi:hypothetical protein PanWU01x14_159420 [Parasponia andersonii]|uniref:MAPK kinase substrate protein n=1 Tax=Parasponia andersonii TaxID=3476 RepID=A0A2P5CEF0_PARAD|nr:hypothetical protein PanWU01x14_159420 [Parasponia andersonii]